MSKTNIGLVAFVEGAEKAQLGYVYGTFGQMCTVALLDQKAKQYPANNLAGGAMRKVGEKWLDRIVADCSGLIKYYLMADNVGEQPVYDPKYDTNLFNIASEKGTIDTMPDIPGICLYLPGHTAVYIGNGQVIEAAGTAYGVVWSKLPTVIRVKSGHIGIKCGGLSISKRKVWRLLFYRPRSHQPDARHSQRQGSDCGRAVYRLGQMQGKTCGNYHWPGRDCRIGTAP